MLFFVFSLSLFFSFSLAAQEPGLLLHSSFDKFSTRPDYIANPVENYLSGIHHELQLRMYKGVANQGNAVLLDNAEFIGYRAKGNFNPKRGTVSLWIKPVNWKSSSRGYYQVFFEIRAGNYRFVLYKLADGDNICAIVRFPNGSPLELHYPEAQWNNHAWHHLAFTWNSQNAKLYVDGQPPAPGSRREIAMKEDPDFPDEIEWASIWLNPSRGWKTNPEWTTAYDELKIYERVLSPAEILAEYEKFYQSRSISPQALATIPATVPIANATSKSEYSDRFATVEISRETDNLLLHFNVPGVPQRSDITTHDGQLWLNDSVEFHCLGDDGLQRQFIVNPAGCIYDSLDRDVTWNSQAIATGKIHSHNWEVLLTVPLADLGIKGNQFPANFCYSKGSDVNFSYTWSPLRSELAGFSAKEFFGLVNLQESPGHISVTSLGNLKGGILEVKSESDPAIHIESSFTSLSGITGKGPKNTLPPGKTEIVIIGKDQNGKTIYRYVQVATVNQPLTVNTVAFPNENRIECRIDFSASGLKNGKGTVTLADKRSGKIFSSREFFADKPEYTVDLPISKNLPDNSTYVVEVKLGNLSFKRDFRVPDLSLLSTHVAVDHSVPSPWVPVSVDGMQVKVLDRTYDFSKGPLPAQIISRGQELLIQQPAFCLNDKALTWENAKLGKNWGDYVEISAKSQFEGGSAEVFGELWFDGMYKFKLVLSPEQSLEIKNLRLSWSMPAEQSIYAQTPEYTPWKNDEIQETWNPAEYKSLFWLSGTVNGLAWWCSSDANWIINPNKANIIAKRNAVSTVINIEFFASPATLKSKAEYTMVFQATPPGRPDYSLREVAHGQHWFPAADSVNVAGHSGSKTIADDNILNWISLIPVDQDKFRAHMQKLAAEGRKTRLYAMPTHLSSLDAEYDMFFKTWAIQPAITWQANRPGSGEEYVVEPCCANTPLGNIHAYRIDKLYQDNPELSGLYFDIMHCRNCSNTLHGCGGTDAFGKAYSTSIALNLREYTLRILKIHRKHGRCFGIHAHSAYFPFVHDLGDYWMPGEELFSPIEANPRWGYLEVVSPEAHQSAWNPEVRGIFIRTMAQHERIARILRFDGAKKAAFRSDDYALNHLSSCILYDLAASSFGSEKQDHVLFKYWKIIKDVKLNQAQFHGYWIDPIASGSPQMKASWYSWNGNAPYSRLICLVNTGRETAATALEIDWKALGIDRPEALYELWSGKTFTEKDLAAFQLDGHKFMLLGIR
jgi:hypothetical protein